MDCMGNETKLTELRTVVTYSHRKVCRSQAVRLPGYTPSKMHECPLKKGTSSFGTYIWTNPWFSGDVLLIFEGCVFFWTPKKSWWFGYIYNRFLLSPTLRVFFFVCFRWIPTRPPEGRGTSAVVVETSTRWYAQGGVSTKRCFHVDKVIHLATSRCKKPNQKTVGWGGLVWGCCCHGKPQCKLPSFGWGEFVTEIFPPKFKTFNFFYGAHCGPRVGGEIENSKEKHNREGWMKRSLLWGFICTSWWKVWLAGGGWGWCGVMGRRWYPYPIIWMVHSW